MRRLQFNIMRPITVDGLTLHAGPHVGSLKVDRAGRKRFYLDLNYRPVGVPIHEEPPSVNVTELIASADGSIVVI